MENGRSLLASIGLTARVKSDTIRLHSFTLSSNGHNMVYGFRQNNSGGYFTSPAEMIIVVAAKNENHALETAGKAGLYLHGVQLGLDCECCGDRWSNYASEFENAADAKAYAESVSGLKTQYSGDVPAYLVTDDLDWDED